MVFSSSVECDSDAVAAKGFAEGRLSIYIYSVRIDIFAQVFQLIIQDKEADRRLMELRESLQSNSVQHVSATHRGNQTRKTGEESVSDVR